MNASVLQTVLDIGGVTGAAIMDGRGEFLAFQLPAPYDPLLIRDVVQEIRSTADLFHYLDDSQFQMMVAKAGPATVIARQAGEHTVFVLGDEKVNTAMLNVGLNVVCLKIGQSQSQSQSYMSADGSRQSASLGSFGSADRMPPPPDAVGLEVMRSLTAALVEHVGPYAKIMVRDHLKQMNSTPKTITRSQYMSLLPMLANQISDAGQRQAFLAAAQGLLKTH